MYILKSCSTIVNIFSLKKQIYDIFFTNKKRGGENRPLISIVCSAKAAEHLLHESLEPINDALDELAEEVAAANSAVI